MQRAAAELGVKSHKTGFNAGWELRWTPTNLPRGRGSTLKMQGPAFKIFGAVARREIAEGAQSNAAAAEAKSPYSCEGAQLESAVPRRNSPHLREDAQLDAEGAHKVAPVRMDRPQNAYAAGGRRGVWKGSAG